MAEIIKIKASSLVPNPDNPRKITDDSYKTLVNSIKEFPEMLEVRPLIVVSLEDQPGKYMVIGGNQRFKAGKEGKIKEFPCIVADAFTEAQKEEFILKDNVSAGAWDKELLQSEWDIETLKHWGLDFPEWNVNFSPNFAPEAGGRNVTDEDMMNAQAGMNKAFTAQQTKLKVVCPHCANEFQIDKP